MSSAAQAGQIVAFFAGMPLNPTNLALEAKAATSGGNILSGVASFITDPTGANTAAAAAQASADQNAYELGKQASDTATIDNAKIAQEKAGLVTLQTQQADALAQFTAHQATMEQAETNSEQANYTGAFQSIGSAEQRIGGEQAQAVSNAQSLVAQYAARGIKVNAGTVNIAGQTGQGSSLEATAGVNGTGAGAGTAAVTAVAGADATPGSAAVAATNGAPAIAAVAGSPAIAAIAGSAGTAVTAATAATPMQLGVKVYDPATSPLTQLAAYQQKVNLAIRNEQVNVATAGNAELKGIANQVADFETNQAQNLLGFQTTQNNNLAAAQTRLSNDQSLAGLGEDIGASTAAMQEAFTATNLAAYDSSLWLSAFSQIASDAFSLLAGIKIPTYTAPAAPSVPQYYSSPYGDFGAFGAMG
jgi:hypothetical protein